MKDEKPDKITIILDANGNLVETNQYGDLKKNDKEVLGYWIDHVIGAQSNTINTFVDYTKIPNGGFVKTPFTILEFNLSFLAYLQEQRNINPNHSQTFIDELSALVNAGLKTYVTGELTASTGFAIFAINPFSPAVLPAAVGAVSVGWISSDLYDSYLKDDVNLITDYAYNYFIYGNTYENPYSNTDPSGLIAIGKNAENQLSLNYTPLPGKNLTQSESEAKAIELLNSLSGGKVFGVTPIKSVTINHSSSQNPISSNYSVESFNDISRIAQAFKTDTDSILASNPFFLDRISSDGNFILLNPSDVLHGNMFSFSPDLLGSSNFTNFGGFNINNNIINSIGYVGNALIMHHL